MVAERDDAHRFGPKLHRIVPVLEPLAPDVMVSQDPDITLAYQDMVPVPVLETAKSVVPCVAATLRDDGDTDNTGSVMVKGGVLEWGEDRKGS